MIGLSTQTYDLDGYVFLEDTDIDWSNSDIQTLSRRVTRTGTLDTGAYLDDRGYAHGDRSLSVAAKGGQSMYESLSYLLQNYSTLWVTLPDGAFIGSLQRVRPGRRGIVNLTILLQGDA